MGDLYALIFASLSLPGVAILGCILGAKNQAAYDKRQSELWGNAEIESFDALDNKITLGDGSQIVGGASCWRWYPSGIQCNDATADRCLRAVEVWRWSKKEGWNSNG